MVLDPSIPLQTRSFDTLSMLENGSQIAQQWQQQSTDKELGRIYNEAQGDLSKMMELGKQSKMARFVMPQLTAQQSAQDKAVLDQQKSIAEISKTNSEAFKNNQQGGEYSANTGQKKLGALNQAIMQGAQSGDKSSVLIGLLGAQQAGLISPEDLSMQTKLIQAMSPDELKQYASNVAFAGAKDPASLMFTDANTRANNATSEANNVRSTNASIYATDTGAETADKNRAQQQSQFNTTQAFNQQKLYFEQNKPIGFETGNDGYRYAIYPNGKGMRVLGEDGQPIKMQVKGNQAQETAQREEGLRTQRVDTVLDEIERILPGATNSYLGAGVDMLGNAFGKATNGSMATSQLKTLSGQLVALMPKMSGPQSDKDVAMYKDMAGKLDDPTSPVETRQAALKTIRSLNNKYKEMAQPAGGNTSNSGAKPSALSFFQ